MLCRVKKKLPYFEATKKVSTFKLFQKLLRNEVRSNGR